MFVNNMIRTSKSMSMLGMANRSMLTVTGKTYLAPEGLDDVMNHLDALKPTYTLLYFTASWNPICANMEKDYEALTGNFGNWHHIRVDCDKTPNVKRYFDARVEPQFLMLVNGGQIERQIGYNFGKLETKLATIQTEHSTNIGYFGDSKDTWERFYDEFDRFARYGEYDRDGFRNYYEPVTDKHRGPGSI